MTSITIDAECPICLQLCLPPCILSNCGHMVCGQCIDQLQKNQGLAREFDCPLCKGRVVRITVCQVIRSHMNPEDDEQLAKELDFLQRYNIYCNQIRNNGSAETPFTRVVSIINACKTATFTRTVANRYVHKLNVSNLNTGEVVHLRQHLKTFGARTVLRVNGDCAVTFPNSASLSVFMSQQ